MYKILKGILTDTTNSGNLTKGPCLQCTIASTEDSDGCRRRLQPLVISFLLGRTDASDIEQLGDAGRMHMLPFIWKTIQTSSECASELHSPGLPACATHEFYMSTSCGRTCFAINS